MKKKTTPKKKELFNQKINAKGDPKMKKEDPKKKKKR